MGGSAPASENIDQSIDAVLVCVLFLARFVVIAIYLGSKIWLDAMQNRSCSVFSCSDLAFIRREDTSVVAFLLYGKS